MDDVFVCF